MTINVSCGPFYFSSTAEWLLKGRGKYKPPRRPHPLVDPSARQAWRLNLAYAVKESRSLCLSGDPRAAIRRMGEIKDTHNIGCRSEGLLRLAMAQCLYEMGDRAAAVDHTNRAIEELMLTTDSVALLVAAVQRRALLEPGITGPQDGSWNDPRALEVLYTHSISDIRARQTLSETEIMEFVQRS